MSSKNDKRYQNLDVCFEQMKKDDQKRLNEYVDELFARNERLLKRKNNGVLIASSDDSRYITAYLLARLFVDKKKKVSVVSFQSHNNDFDASRYFKDTKNISFKNETVEYPDEAGDKAAKLFASKTSVTIVLSEISHSKNLESAVASVASETFISRFKESDILEAPYLYDFLVENGITTNKNTHIFEIDVVKPGFLNFISRHFL